MDGDELARESDMLRTEISNVIRRYSQETSVTIYQAIGVLEVVKLDLAYMVAGSDDD